MPFSSTFDCDKNKIFMRHFVFYIGSIFFTLRRNLTCKLGEKEDDPSIPVLVPQVLIFFFLQFEWLCSVWRMQKIWHFRLGVRAQDLSHHHLNRGFSQVIYKAASRNGIQNRNQFIPRDRRQIRMSDIRKLSSSVLLNIRKPINVNN